MFTDARLGERIFRPHGFGMLLSVLVFFSLLTFYILYSLYTGHDKTESVPSLPGWKLVWHDEFNGKGLPSAEKWDYETGFERNREEQYYTKARLENIRQENGCLLIEGRKESWSNKSYSSQAPKEDW